MANAAGCTVPVLPSNLSNSLCAIVSALSAGKPGTPSMCNDLVAETLRHALHVKERCNQLDVAEAGSSRYSPARRSLPLRGLFFHGILMRISRLRTRIAPRASMMNCLAS